MTGAKQYNNLSVLPCVHELLVLCQYQSLQFSRLCENRHPVHHPEKHANVSSYTTISFIIITIKRDSDFFSVTALLMLS